MLKAIYESLFDISSYKEKKYKKIIKSFLYLVVIAIFSGILFAGMGFVKFSPIVDNITEDVYESVPNFTLSASGLEIEGDKVYEITFAGKNFYIDGQKEFLDIVIENELDEDENVMFIGKDGYANVIGRTLKNGGYFNDVTVLKDVTLTKNDFTLIYEIIKMINKDLIVVLLSIIVALFISWMVGRNIIRGFILYVIAKLKNRNLLFKEACNVAIYSDTYYCLMFLLILLVDMNMTIGFRVLFMEVVSLMYLLLAAKKLLKEGCYINNEVIKCKKRP